MKFRFVALILTAIILIIYPIQSILPMEQLILVSDKVWERPWTLVTHIFLHSTPRHLLGNMFALALFGSILERLIGWRRFLVIFFIAGLASSVADVFFYQATLGASGALFGVLGTLAVLRPRMPVFAFGIPIPMILATVLWILLDLAGLFYPDNVAHASHLLGMLAGFVFGFYLREPRVKKNKQPLISDKEHRDWEEKYM